MVAVQRIFLVAASPGSEPSAYTKNMHVFIFSLKRATKNILQQARGTPLYSQEDVDQDTAIKHLGCLTRFLVTNI